MAIRLETSKRNGIDNFQDVEITDRDRRWFRLLDQRHPKATRRSDPSAIFNCHGLTFASRRTKILDWRNLVKIIEDDNWTEVSMEAALGGDIVIYFDEEGDPNHSGLVVEAVGAVILPRICSKWGVAGEYLHWLNDVPSIYGPVHKFYRCRL